MDNFHLKFSVPFLMLVTGGLAAEWTIALDYSVNDFVNTYSLGTIELRRGFDGNYTGTFKSSSGNSFGERVLSAVDGSYKVRAVSSTQNGQAFISSNSPCLLLQTRLFHLFWVAVDAERQTLMSLVVYPDAVALSKDGGHLSLSSETCPVASFAPKLVDRIGDGAAKGVVHVNQRGSLPSPDTAYFVQKMERDRRSKQQGGEADNRSFLAKYWMYIVPVVIFMLVSNAMSPEQGEGAAQA